MISVAEYMDSLLLSALFSKRSSYVQWGFSKCCTHVQVQGSSTKQSVDFCWAAECAEFNNKIFVFHTHNFTGVFIQQITDKTDRKWATALFISTWVYNNLFETKGTPLNGTSHWAPHDELTYSFFVQFIGAHKEFIMIFCTTYFSFHFSQELLYREFSTFSYSFPSNTEKIYDLQFVLLKCSGNTVEGKSVRVLQGPELK